jgi:hypothetical protein
MIERAAVPLRSNGALIQRDEPGPLPPARGPLSDALRSYMHAPANGSSLPEPTSVKDPLTDDDLNLALYLCYELSYRGIRGIDERLEWDAALVAFRLSLEEVFEIALRAALPREVPQPGAISDELMKLARTDGAPSLSKFMERNATIHQFREFIIHRSSYHLKEADPHSLAIARLSGAAKAAMLEIQADEYGDGNASDMHSALFAASMRALGLDDGYGAYLSSIPGRTLALTNVMSLFGFHHRLRGALLGHLALFELTSSIPNRRYGNGLRRCGFGPEATRFFDVHVVADAVHGAIAAHDLAGGFVDGDRERAETVLFGARALQLLEGRVGGSWMDAWRAGQTTLLSAGSRP